MREECRKRAARCGKCLRFNVKKRGFHPLRPVTALLMMDFVMFDIAGKLSVSGEGYVFVLVVVDVASRYVWLREMKSKSASEIAVTLMKIFCQWGAPAVVRSDNERALCNKVTRRLAEVLRYEIQNSIEYNPEQVGAVENMVKETKSLLHKWCEDRIGKWVGFLCFIQKALNDREVRRTMSSPFCVMYGRRARRCKGEGEEWVDNVDLLIQRNKEIFGVVLPSLFEVVGERSKKMCEYGDRRRLIVEKPLEVGTEVMIVNQKKTSKKEPLRVGPFTVLDFEEGKKKYSLWSEEGKVLKRGVPRKDMVVVGEGGVVEEEREEGGEEDELFDVEEVVDDRVENEVVEYLVKWGGYDQLTWEPEESFVKMDPIREYWRRKFGEEEMSGSEG
jgi:hypothetical protein